MHFSDYNSCKISHRVIKISRSYNVTTPFYAIKIGLVNKYSCFIMQSCHQSSPSELSFGRREVPFWGDCSNTWSRSLICERSAADKKWWIGGTAAASLSLRGLTGPGWTVTWVEFLRGEDDVVEVLTPSPIQARPKTRWDFAAAASLGWGRRLSLRLVSEPYSG
jgi:hypothetical protein